jgi:lysozyme
MKTSPRGVRLITEFEGFRPTAYRDVVGVWTIGHGFTHGVREGDTLTLEQSMRRLRTELGQYERGVLEATQGRANQNEFDALVSFAFNVGVAGMKRSSVIKAHLRGDKQAAGRAFALWNKAGGKVWPGLTRRRAAEAALYLTPMPDDISDPVEGPRLEMPQSVDPESNMTSSTINRAAALTGGAAALASAREIVETAQGAAEVAHQAAGVLGWLGRWAVPVLLVAVVGLAGYIIWQRLKQRRDGWA